MKIDKLLKDKGSIAIQRKTFNLNSNRYKDIKDSKIVIPKKFEIKKIGKEFVNQYEKYYEIIQYPSRFGFCIVNGKK